MKMRPLCSLILITSLNAGVRDWIILDNMGDRLFPAWTLTEAQDGYGQLTQVSNPFNSYENALYVETFGQGISWGHTSAALPLKTPIAEGESGTIYFRYGEDGNSRNYFYGFSDQEITPDGEGGYSAPLEWKHFEGTIMMTHDSSELKVRDGNAYRTFTTESGSRNAQIETQTWYDVWIVITNAPGTSDDEYAVYIRGGDYRTQTLLQLQIQSNIYNTAYFREGTTDSIKTIFIRTLAGDPTDPNNGDGVYLAAIAQAPGVELSTPPYNIIIECFSFWECRPPDDEAGNMDTGPWMGWINIKKYPWIYSYSLDSWFWVTGTSNSTDQGVWVYLKK